MWIIAVGIPVCLVLVVWILTPRWIVYRRMSRKIHENHGR